MNNEELQDPFRIVARVLSCDSDSLSLESQLRRTHRWDSLTHLDIICELEKVYHVKISDVEVEALTKMSAILEFHKRNTTVES
jgi:acyl carrier protein